MRRLLLVLFVVLAVVGVAGTVAEAKSKSQPSSYSQVVDNTTRGRFEADESWGSSSYGLDVYNENYRFARPEEDGSEARFRVEIPETADYAVYARWPEVRGLNASVPVGVEATSGLDWARVNQQRDGGRWVRVGVFEMAAGDDQSVRFSPETDGEGYVVADAVKVIKVSSDEAPSKEAPEEEDSAASKGQEVVREAQRYTGVRYCLGRASRSGMDCSGLTMLVYRKFGVSLPHDIERQYCYGSRVRGQPKAGDLVFFDEHGDGISHGGIATGRGTVVHASDYWNKVTDQDPIRKGLQGCEAAALIVRQSISLPESVSNRSLGVVLREDRCSDGKTAHDSFPGVGK